MRGWVSGRGRTVGCVAVAEGVSVRFQAEGRAEIVCAEADEMQGQLEKIRRYWREIACAGIPPLDAAVVGTGCGAFGRDYGLSGLMPKTL